MTNTPSEGATKPNKADLDAIRARIDRDHHIGLVGIGDMWPECTCGNPPPCQDRDELLALIDEVVSLREQIAAHAKGGAA